MRRKIVAFLLASLSAAGLCWWAAYGTTSSQGSTGRSSGTLTLGTSAIDLSALIWIAKANGYFSEQGLNIEIRLYESGHLAIRDLLAGKLDLATASEFAAVQHAFGHPDLRIVSILDQARDQELVARKDRGIQQLSDLRGKRIGVARGTSAEQYLDLLLILQRMHPRDVHMVDLLPSQQVQALTRGDIDAIMAWEPFATMAKKQLGTNEISWPGQSGQDEYWLLLSAARVIQKRSRAIRSFLVALTSAEDFVASHDTEARRIVAKQLGDGHMDALEES